MRRIYKEARSTWIYLGEAAEESHLIPDLIKRILGSGLSRSSDTVRSVAFTYTVLPPLGDRAWKALNALFRRPWFGRVWVIQEAALAY